MNSCHSITSLLVQMLLYHSKRRRQCTFQKQIHRTRSLSLSLSLRHTTTDPAWQRSLDTRPDIAPRSFPEYALSLISHSLHFLAKARQVIYHHVSQYERSTTLNSALFFSSDLRPRSLGLHYLIKRIWRLMPTFVFLRRCKTKKQKYVLKMEAAQTPSLLASRAFRRCSRQPTASSEIIYYVVEIFIRRQYTKFAVNLRSDSSRIQSINHSSNCCLF